MKKILIILLLMFSAFTFIVPETFSACEYGTDIGDSLDACLKNSDLVDGSNVDVKAGGGFQTQVNLWVKNISLYLGVFAVGSIVLGGLMLTLSAGEEEKIKKAKDVVKWGIIGFVGIITASAIISLVVRIIYSI